ncbi:unnamed protein product [Cuscuta campestris]|uniref:Uncharacterized protein n=1 Tax=Cuscuta campestris TaxID=132261 RepID=A0A484N2P4_9ASTE|nr:unnamed protein product [Cuscuta campestris]
MAMAWQTRAAPFRVASGGSGESPVTHSLLRLSRFKCGSSSWGSTWMVVLRRQRPSLRPLMLHQVFR